MMGALFFHSNVGDYSTGYTVIIGRHRVGVMNGNGLQTGDFSCREQLGYRWDVVST